MKYKGEEVDMSAIPEGYKGPMYVVRVFERNGEPVEAFYKAIRPSMVEEISWAKNNS